MTVIGDGAHWTKYRHLMDFTYRQEFLETAYFELSGFKNSENRREKNYADIDARMQIKKGPDGFDPSKTKNGDLVLDRNVIVDNTHGFKFKTGATIHGHEFMTGVEYKRLTPGPITVEYVDKNYNKAGPNKWTGKMESSEAGAPATVVGAFLADKFSLTDSLHLDIGLRYDLSLIHI